MLCVRTTPPGGVRPLGEHPGADTGLCPHGSEVELVAVRHSPLCSQVSVLQGGGGRGQECVGQPWFSPCSVSSSALWDGGRTLLPLWPRDAGGDLRALLEKPGPLVESCPQLQPCRSCHHIKRCLRGKGQWLRCFCSFRSLLLGAAHLGTSQTGGQ